MAEQEKRFIKGLFKDTAHIDQIAGSWRYARNMVLRDPDGAISNEGGTELAGYLAGDGLGDTGRQDDKVIGVIEVNDDRVVLFIKDVVSNFYPKSRIALFDAKNDTYTDLYVPITDPSDPSGPHDLNFQESNPIEGTFKINSKGDLIVYWTDDLNPPRAFNVDRQLRSRDLNPKHFLYEIDPQFTHSNHINLLNLFPNSGPVPHIDIDDQGTHQNCVIEGGGLRTGVYYLALAYVDDDYVSTNYLTVSNPIPIVDEFDHTIPITKKDGMKEGSQTTKAIRWNISNLNTDYKFLRPVVIRKMGEAVEGFKLGDIEIFGATTEITFSGIEGFTPEAIEKVIIDTISYDTAKTINQLDDILYLGNVTGTKDVGYQKYANNIKLYSHVTDIDPFDVNILSVDNLQTGFGTRPVNSWGNPHDIETIDPTKSYRYIPNHTKNRGYMRDEIYAFYIAFILNDGSMSYAYHIPGRQAQGNELKDLVSLNFSLFGGLWDDIQKMSPDYAKRFHFCEAHWDAISWTVTYGLTNDYRGMNYWENATETYPNTSEYEVWDSHPVTNSGMIDDYRGQNVRHHHFPSNRNPDRKSILSKHECETKRSEGSASSLPAYNDELLEFRHNDNYRRATFKYTPRKWEANWSDPNNDVWLVDNCWNYPTSALHNHPDCGTTFTCMYQPMKVKVSWKVVFEQSHNVNVHTVKSNLKKKVNGVVSTINGNSIGAGNFGSCGGSNVDWNGITSWTSYQYLQPGDQIWIETHRLGSNRTVGQCKSSWNSCATSRIKFRVWTIAADFDPGDYNDAKISHTVRRLGFKLEDIKIPRGIADKIQGFKIYYAERNHADRTILGQAPLLPAIKKNAVMGICKEAASSTVSADAAHILSTLSNIPEDFYQLNPFPGTPSDHETISTLWECPAQNSNAPLEKHNRFGFKVFKFHDFYLLRTKNSLSTATHIDLQYKVSNLAWNGMSVNQDRKMMSKFKENDDGIKSIEEFWGWDPMIGQTDAIINCYPAYIKSAIFAGCRYVPVSSRTQPRLLGQKAKTYLRGDSIFSGATLGFGGKLFNEGGESCIALKLQDEHEISAMIVPSAPESASGHSGWTMTNMFGFYGHVHVGLSAVLVNPLDNAHDWSQTSAGQRSQVHIANLKAFKTDVYKSIDTQKLIWTGFEVIGDDLNNFIFEDDGSPFRFNNVSADYKTETVHQEGIYGGDTSICRYGFYSAVSPSDDRTTSEPIKAIHYHIVESTDNINFRHTEDDKSQYFPNAIAKDLIREGGSNENDYTHPDNLKYNDNYSALNDIRPAFPLPLRETKQEDFPTRAHRSAKSDPTSIIDNYRIFLANQFKDLPRNRGDLWRLSSFNNLLYFHMEDSLYATKGKQSMQMKDGSEAFVGSGDIFAQEPDEIIQTEGGFGGTQSQWACLTTRHGYFFVDRNTRKVFLMKDQLNEISNMGMESWFKDNFAFALEEYGMTGCALDNPLIGLGFHAIWDPKYKRILLTKRDLKPTEAFINHIAYTGWPPPQNSVRWNDKLCKFEVYLTGISLPGINSTDWQPIEWDDTYYFTKGVGWTISYYPELGLWGSFHDYQPYIYFNTSKTFYSFTDNYDRPVWVQGTTTLATHQGTTYGNAGIWKHNSMSVMGIQYKENERTTLNNTDWLTVADHKPFEFEVIHNETKNVDSLTSAFNYTADVYNQNNVNILDNGFTSFIIYNTFQISGERVLEYLVNVRRIGNNWKINKFRDMAALAVNTNDYYMSTNTNIIGGINTGTETTSNVQTMFTVSGMSETINAAYIDLAKTWDNQRKFMDKWVGIRLIYNNISNNLVNLYSTAVESRKTYR